jgi:hypothetical protein
MSIHLLLWWDISVGINNSQKYALTQSHTTVVLSIIAVNKLIKLVLCLNVVIHTLVVQYIRATRLLTDEKHLKNPE